MNDIKKLRQAIERTMLEAHEAILVPDAQDAVVLEFYNFEPTIVSDDCRPGQFDGRTVYCWGISDELARQIAAEGGKVRRVRMNIGPSVVRDWLISEGNTTLEHHQAYFRKILDAAERPGGECGDLIEDGIAGRRKVIPTGFPILDRVAKPTIPGTVVLKAGGIGASKSFMVSQEAKVQISAGVKVSILELEESRGYHTNRALAQWAGLPGLTDPDWCAANPGLARQALEDFADDIRQFESIIRDCTDKVVTLDNVADWVEQHCAAGDRVIYVDPVTAAERGRGDAWEVDNHFLQRVKKAAYDSGSTVVLVTHPVKSVCGPDLSTIAGAAAYSRFCQTILWLEYHRVPIRSRIETGCGSVEDTHNRTLHILKARNGPGQGLRLAYRFEPGLTLTELGIIVDEPRGCRT